jgi:transposase
MTTTKKNRKPTSESIVREIKRRTRRKFSAEEKIRIVLDGLRGEASITDLCRREGLHPTQYYKWSKAFLEAGKGRLNGDTIREAGSDEVKGLRDENDELKMAVAELTLRVRKLKKTSPDLECGSIDT